jgi:hypothetical protein
MFKNKNNIFSQSSINGSSEIVELRLKNMALKSDRVHTKFRKRVSEI